MNETQITENILEICKTAAKSSAEIILNNFAENSLVKNKGSHKDIVTHTDVASQKNIKKIIINELEKMKIKKESVGFIEEESSAHSVQKHNFIVDPIDGTSNFAAGIPYSCISIGYALEKNVQLGVVYNPFSKTMYYGIKNRGSYIQIDQNKAVSLSISEKDINSWMVGVHFNGIEVFKEQFASYQKLYPHVRGVRSFGSLTLEICAVADNSLDVVYNRGCYFWDLAAASVILREAGAQLYSYSGEILEFNWQDTHSRYEIVACHPEISKDALSFIQ